MEILQKGSLFKTIGTRMARLLGGLSHNLAKPDIEAMQKIEAAQDYGIVRDEISIYPGSLLLAGFDEEAMNEEEARAMATHITEQVNILRAPLQEPDIVRRTTFKISIHDLLQKII